jgi:hypothetical protein
MKAKSALAFLFLILIWVCAAGIEYDLAIHFRILFSVASVLALVVLLRGLYRAPEGYEDESGFHIGAPARFTLR